MKFPDVSKIGAIEIEGAGRYTAYLIADDWEPDLGGHDSEHARGGCECPCSSPLDVIEAVEALPSRLVGPPLADRYVHRAAVLALLRGTPQR